MFYNLTNKHNQLAVVEDFSKEWIEENYKSEHKHLYPKYNSLIWTWIGSIDYNIRYGLNYCDTYKYKYESPGVAFIKEWADMLKISKSRDDWYKYNEHFDKINELNILKEDLNRNEVYQMYSLIVKGKFFTYSSSTLTIEGNFLFIESFFVPSQHTEWEVQADPAAVVG